MKPFTDPLTPHAISYCHATWSPWWGCSPVSAGCENCYAAAQAKRFGGPDYTTGAPRRKTKDWSTPRKWNRQARADDRPRVFVSMCDWLDPEVPADWLAQFIELVADTPKLNWLLLTKRPELWLQRLLSALKQTVEPALLKGWLDGKPPENVWVGATVEHELTAWRIPALLEIPASIHWLSIEPMLGHIGFGGSKLEWLSPFKDADAMGRRNPRVDWVVCGGESGPRARPMRAAWARDLLDECRAVGTPFFFKQWGGWLPKSQLRDLVIPPATPSQILRNPGEVFYSLGKKAAGCLLDGREWKEMPT